MEDTGLFSCHIHYRILVKDSDKSQDEREKSHNMLMESLLKMDLERKRDEQERRREVEERRGDLLKMLSHLSLFSQEKATGRSHA